MAHLRVMAGLSQRGLAKHAGVGYQTIRRIEGGENAGHLQLLTVQKIATALDVSLTDLINESTAQPAPIENAIPLNLGDYKLLKNIEQGQKTTSTLTNEQRRIHLPRLVKAGLVTVNGASIKLSPAAKTGLNPQSLHR